MPSDDPGEGVRNRLDRFGRLGDLSVLDPEAEHEAEALLVATPDDLGARILVGWLYWYRWLGGRDADLDRAVELFAPVIASNPDEVPGPIARWPKQEVPLRVDRLEGRHELGIQIIRSGLAAGDPATAAAGVEVLRSTAEATADDDPRRSGRLSNLAFALTEVGEATRDHALIDEAIEVSRSCIAAAADEHDRTRGAGLLGGAFLVGWTTFGQMRYLTGAVEAHRAAFAISSDAGPLPMDLTNFAVVLIELFRQSGEDAAIAEAVEVARRGVAVRPPDDPDLGGAWAVLADALDAAGSSDEAEDAYRQGEALLANDPRWQTAASGLARLLVARFDRTGEQPPLREAVEVQRAVAERTGSADRLSELAVMARKLYRSTSEDAALGLAVTAGRAAVERADSGTDVWVVARSNLANDLAEVVARDGDEALLHESVTLLEEAATGGYHTVDVLANLAGAYVALFHRTADSAAADGVVSAYRTALDLTGPDEPGRVDLLERLAGAASGLMTRPEGLPAASAVLAAARAALPGGRATALPRLGATLVRLHERTGQPDVLDEGLTLLEGSAETLENRSALAHALRLRYTLTGDRESLTRAVELHRQVVAAHPAGSNERAGALVNASVALVELSRFAGDPEPLMRAIAGLREAIASIETGSALGFTARSNLASCLSELAEQTSDLRALAESIELGRQLVALMDAAGGASVEALSNLGLHLQLAYERQHDVAVLDEAIGYARRAVDSVPSEDPRHAVALTNLGLALSNRYEYQADPAVLDEALALTRRALAETQQDSPELANRLSNLASYLLARFESSDDQAVLAEAVDTARRAAAAVRAGHFRGGAVLLNLGVALGKAATRTDDLQLRLETVDVYRALVGSTPESHPDLGLRLGNFGVALRTLHQRTGDSAALADALSVGRRAVAVTRAGQPHFPYVRGVLAGTLIIAYQRQGDVERLVEAVDLGREAAATMPDGDERRGPALQNLSGALYRLYSETGDGDALVDAVDIGRAAVAATAAGNSTELGLRLSNLGVVLGALTDRLGSPRELVAERLAVLERAATTIPADHPERLGILSSLASAVGAQPDPDAARRAVALAREAVPPDGDPERAARLSNLANDLLRLHGRTGDEATLDEAIAAARDALVRLPVDHPNHATVCFTLAGALARVFRTRGERTALEEALRCYADATDSPYATPLVRLAAARGRGIAAFDGERFDVALAAYESAVALLPRVAPRELARVDREHRLGDDVRNLGSDAAAAALAAGRPGRAVELLEQARGVLLAERLDARDDADDLRAAHPALADELGRLRAELDLLGDSAPPLVGDGLAARFDAGRRAGRKRADLSAAWDDLLSRTRAQPGFEEFLRPTPLKAMQAFAAEGPIVLVVLSRLRSDAIILTAGAEPAVVELPMVTVEGTIEQANRLLVAQAASADAAGTPQSRRSAQADIRAVLRWLWDGIVGAVLDRLDPAEPPRRVWWCLTGVLALLPVHAAVSESGDCALDRIVSTYTPTVRALRYARRNPDNGPAGGALLVGVPAAPGTRTIAGVTREITELADELPDSTVLLGADATFDRVTSELPRHRVVHLACHAQSDWNEPANSRLLLQDHETRPLSVLEVSRLRLTTAELAYLSACSTARVNDRLADEAVHLTAAFHLAGFREVVGTLWPVDDVTSRHAAVAFHTILRDSNTTPARALHATVVALRKALPTVPSVWAAYVHVGR